MDFCLSVWTHKTMTWNLPPFHLSHFSTQICVCWVTSHNTHYKRRNLICLLSNCLALALLISLIWNKQFISVVWYKHLLWRLHCQHFTFPNVVNLTESIPTVKIWNSNLASLFYFHYNYSIYSYFNFI